MTSKIDSEIKKFSLIAKDWWKKDGKFKILHQFNKARIDFIDNSIKQYNEDNNIKNQTILDIGCGGGLLSEPFYKKGFSVVGIDASEESIYQATQHSKIDNLNIKYITTTAEELLASDKHQYDIIFAMEIIEHIANPNTFIDTISQLLKPNGLIFISTINRNIKSLLLAKFSAEYILNWLPKGTHSYNKFITPAEVSTLLNTHHLFIQDIKGIDFNIFNNTWNLQNKPQVNYILCAKKLTK